MVATVHLSRDITGEKSVLLLHLPTLAFSGWIGRLRGSLVADGDRWLRSRVVSSVLCWLRMIGTNLAVFVDPLQIDLVNVPLVQEDEKYDVCAHSQRARAISNRRQHGSMGSVDA